MSELEFQELRLRWKVDTRDRPSWDQKITSSSFRFKEGGEWRLGYFYYEGGHFLFLKKALDRSFVPFDALVHLESVATERILPELSMETRCTLDNRTTILEGKSYLWVIWRRFDHNVERSDSKFRRDHHLRFQVVIRDGDHSDKYGAKESIATQTECSIPEDFRVSCMESLSADFAQMMVQGSNPDVIFKCSGQSIGAHAAVISARSEVIASMLASDMVEGRTKVVKIPNIEPDVFRHFLRYIYTGRLPVLSVDLALNLYESGDQYAVLGLTRMCSEYLVEHLTAQNACSVLIVANAHSDEGLMEKVINYMVENKIPLVSDRWSAFSVDHPNLANKVLKRGWDVFLK